MPPAAGDGDRRADLVLEGGGVKGIALAGALAALEEEGYATVNLAGTSAGAVVGALHLAGYRAGEVREILLARDFPSLLDRGLEDRVPLIGPALSVLFEQGVHEGRAFREWIAGLLAARGVRTFADLRGGDGRFPHRLQVIASDLTGRRLLVLPRDAPRLGLDPDALEVADAVRMSMSIPLVFEPVRLPNRRTGAAHVIVDGGLLSNFPVWLFDAQARLPRRPTFGLMLVDDPAVPPAERIPPPNPAPFVPTIVPFLESLIATALEANDRRYLESATFVRTIPIPTLDIGLLDFGLSREDKLRLLASGHSAARRFLASWDFEAYVARFRSGAPRRGRREELAELLGRRTAEAE